MKLSELQEGKDYTIATPEKKKGSGVFGAVGNVGVGLAKSVGELGLGLGTLGQKMLNAPYQALGGEGRQVPLYTEGTPERQQAQEMLKAQGGAQQAGKFVGDVAQYIAPTGRITQAQAALRGVAGALPKGLQTAGKIGARFAPEAVGTGTVALARSGGDIEQAKSEALLAGGTSVALGGVGKLARATYFPELQDSVSKAFSIGGKKSAGAMEREMAQKIQGLAVLKERAPKIGNTTFNPKKATYADTLQAWQRAKDDIYQEYTSLATKAGEKATVDFTPVLKNLANALSEPSLKQTKDATRAIIKDLNSNFDDITAVNIMDAQKLVQDLNKTATNVFKGTTDNIVGEVNVGVAREMREVMDKVITESEGAGYQALRNQYGALKSLENDLVRMAQQDARGIGGGLTDYANIFSSGDVLAGLFSAQPSLVAKGAVQSGLASLRRALGARERFLRRSFELIDKEEVSPLTQRLFGGTRSADAPIEASAKENTEKYLKEIQPGMSLKDVSGGKASTDLTQEVKKYKSVDDIQNGAKEASDEIWSIIENATKRGIENGNIKSRTMDFFERTYKNKDLSGSNLGSVWNNEKLLTKAEADRIEMLQSVHSKNKKVAEEAIQKERIAQEELQKTDTQKIANLNKVEDFLGKEKKSTKYDDFTSEMLDDDYVEKVKNDIVKELKKKKAKRTYVSESGSEYWELPDGTTIRVADHDVPETAQRLDRQIQTGEDMPWDEEIVINQYITSQPRMIGAELKKLEQIWKDANKGQ